MKKIMLIEPGAKNTVFPPIGLLHLASFLREEYEIIIKDYSGIELNPSKIEKDIKKIDPFIVGVRVLTGPPIPRAILISKIAKENEKIVIWGGPHPTILPKQTLENEYVDAVVIGEGEYSLRDLIRHYENKNKNLRGIGIKENGKIKIFPPHDKIVDLETGKIPAWDLLENLNRYFPFKKNNLLPISTTRGCAFKCGFCHNSNKNVNCYLGNYRVSSPQKAIDELKFVQGLVKNEITFLDVAEDLHLVSYNYAQKFCDAIKKSGIPDLKWQTSVRYSMMDERIIKLISENNCKSVMLGIESGSERIQKINGKIVKLSHAMRIAKSLRKKGVFVRNTYIFGHPTETIKELNESINFIKKVPSDENLIQLYRPMPGTPYFDMCVHENKIKKIPKKTEDWQGFGVLGKDINVSNIPSKTLFSNFYKINAIEQLKYLFNEQKFYFKNKMYAQSFDKTINNRFTFKLKEYLDS